MRPYRRLRREGLAAAGAGTDLAEAEKPVEITLASGARLLVFGIGSTSSGIPRDWAARQDRSGIWLLSDLSPATAHRTAERILALRKTGDLIVVSIHWGSNWGYEVPEEQRSFAHALIDAGACDLLHGHSSHHPRPLEVYKGKLVLYGCGDFITDYEGIYGYEQYRGDLALAYLARYSGEGALTELTLAALSDAIASGCDARPRRIRSGSNPRSIVSAHPSAPILRSRTSVSLWHGNRLERLIS